MDLRFLTVLVCVVCATYAFPRKLDLRSFLQRRQDVPEEALKGCMALKISREDCIAGIKECIKEGISMDNCGEYHKNKQMDGECAYLELDEDECKKFHAAEVPKEAVMGCMLMGYSKEECVFGIKECILEEVELEKCGEYHEQKKAKMECEELDLDEDECKKFQAIDVPNEALLGCMIMRYPRDVCEFGIKECIYEEVPLDKCGEYHYNKEKKPDSEEEDDKREFSKIARINAYRRALNLKRK